MKLILVHTKWMFNELWRQPTYVVSTIGFPTLFYLIFAVPESGTRHAANLLLASFSGFAIFGVFFLQIGVSLAQERSRSWYTYLRLLPVRGWQLFFARLLSTLIFATLAVVALSAVAAWQTEATLSSGEIYRFIVALAAGSVLFCLMGLSLGLWFSERVALPVGNLIYLPLSFAGGLWKPPEILPASVQTFSKYLPTRYFGEIAWAAVRDEWADQVAWRGLIFYIALFSAVAYLGYRRESVRRGA